MPCCCRVGVQQVCLRFRHLLAQCALYLIPYGEGGQRAGGDVAPPRLRQLQRDIQTPPGRQGGLLAAELGLLGGEAVHVRRQFIDVLGRFQLRCQRRLVQIFPLGDAGTRCQQTRFLGRRGAAQDVYGRLQLPLAGQQVRCRSIAPAQSVGKRLYIRLADLQTAHVLETAEYGIVVTLQRQHLQMLHFDNGHLPLHHLFQQVVHGAVHPRHSHGTQGIAVLLGAIQHGLPLRFGLASA